MAESSSRAKSNGGGSSTQKKKFYKFAGVDKRGGRGGSSGGRGGRQAEGSTKVYPMDKYRPKPLPEVMCHTGISATTAKGKERDAEKELIERLEEIADELYPETVEAAIKEEEDLDFEEMLKRELNSMGRDEKSKRFQVCRYDTMCVVYINVLPPLDPGRLVSRLLEVVEQTGKSPFKSIQRIVPIAAVSQATLPLLAETAKPVLEKAFNEANLKFAVNTSSRNSSKLERLEMIKTVAEQVNKLEQGHKVDLKSPDRTILVELFKNMVGICVVEDYDRFKKFNPSQLAEHVQKSRQPPKTITSKGMTKENESTEVVETINESSTNIPRVESTEAAEVSSETPKSQSKHHSKRANRVARAQKLASSTSEPVQSKRKAEEAELEDGEVDAGELETGELVENGNGKLKDGEIEIISGGKAVKMRKVDE